MDQIVDDLDTEEQMAILNYGSAKLEPSIDQITSNIYLGNYDSAFLKNYLKKIGITHILICGEGMQELYPDDFIYMKLPIMDSLNQEIKSYFKLTNPFIESSTKIYIHCRAGRSRSPTILCAYLMEKFKINSQIVLEFLYKKRKVYPNSRFKDELREYTYELMRTYLFENFFEGKDLEKIIS